MDQLPIFLTLRGQRCLVVGGGEVAERKVRQLLAAHAAVTVNSPQLAGGLQELLAAKRIEAVLSPFDAGLIDTHLLVYAATSDTAVNRAVAAAAHQALRLCNIVDDPTHSSFISPSIVDRSPLLIAVSSGGRAPVLARMLRQQLERWLPLRLGELAAWAGQWRETIKTRLPDIAARRRFWEQAFSGTLGAQVLAGRTQAADTALHSALDAQAQADASRTHGEAWLVGAGPGDPELLSLRGFHLLQHADVVLHDRLVAPELLAFARRDAELIDVGKTGGGPGASQAAINELLLEKVRAGKRVCRLKGGDPYVFGRGSEEAAALAQAGLPFQVIPGITAANGCGAYAGIPLTHRGLAQAVTFVTGHAAAEATAGEPDWAALAALGQTLVIYMSGRKLAAIAAELIARGRGSQTPAAVVIAGTLPEQRIISGTLADIAARSAEAGIGSPALLYVGEVVGLAGQLGWQTPASTAARPNLELRPGDLQ
ncbi:MAG: siroheme synthase CysG [Gammaproteobacteria bacterium]|nr:siroheme synthase CysG [Gammaproteobacteria bacterium]